MVTQCPASYGGCVTGILFSAGCHIAGQLFNVFLIVGNLVLQSLQFFRTQENILIRAISGMFILYSLNLFFLYCSSLYYYWTVFCLSQRQFSFYQQDSFPSVLQKDFCPFDSMLQWIFNVYSVWKTCSLTFSDNQSFFFQSSQCGLNGHFALVHGFCQVLDGKKMNT